MESIKLSINYMENIRCQAKKLTAANLVLAALFDKEAARLYRQDEASRLRSLLFSVRQQLEMARKSETSSSFAHSQAKILTSTVELGLGIFFKITSKDEQQSAFADNILRNIGGKQLPFGTIFVSIGPKGLPDDVTVVSISRLARDSKLTEHEVIRKIREDGHLLYGEEPFARLIDRLIGDVLEGRLLLPISIEKLTQIQASTIIKLQGKKSEWVRLNPPRQSP